jgi:hypothetical protein
MRISKCKPKKELSFLIFLFYTSSLLFAQSATDDFTGKWKAEEGKIVEITRSGNVYTGIGIPEKVEVLKDVKFRDGKWEGIVRNPLNKKEAKCEVELNGPDKLKIIAKIGKFRKIFFWTKVRE